MTNSDRVVVTGLGQVTSFGDNLDKFWESLINGKSGISEITKFDTSEYPSKIGAEVADFDSSDFIDKKSAKRMGLFT